MKKFLKRTLSGVGFAALGLFGLDYVWCQIRSGVETSHSAVVIHDEQLFGSREYLHGKQFPQDSLRLEYGCFGKPTVVFEDRDRDNLVERIRFLKPECRLSHFKEADIIRSEENKELFDQADSLYASHKIEMDVERIIQRELQKKEKEVDYRDLL